MTDPEQTDAVETDEATQADEQPADTAGDAAGEDDEA